MSSLAQGSVLPVGHACATFRESRPTGSSSIMHRNKHTKIPRDLDR